MANIFRRHDWHGTPQAFCKALRQKRIKSLGHRWYSLEYPSEPYRTACKHGFLIGCLTALLHHNIWVPEHREIHFIARRSTPKVDLPGACVHRAMLRSDYAWHTPPAQADKLIVPLADALEQALHYHDAETGLILVESMLNLKKIDCEAADYFISRVQAEKQTVLKRYITNSQSGSETRMRNFLISKRYKVQAQVYIEGVGRVDLLVGKSLIIECDSTAFHSQPLQVAQDRMRVIEAKKRGYETLRFSYQQIWHSWEETQQFLCSYLKQGHHLKQPKRLG